MLKKRIWIIPLIVATLLCLTFKFDNLLDARGSSDELYFTILHTNDEHSALFPAPAVDFHPRKENPTRGGIARLAGVVNRIREEKKADHEPLLLLSGGDFTAGTVYNWLTFEGYAPELSLMQQIGYDVVTLGNHEFDNGPDVLADYFKAAGYPEAGGKTALLATNILIPDNHPLSGIGIKKTEIKELENGLRLGFFSIIGDDAVSVIADRGPLTFGDRFEAAQKAVNLLKNEVDIIVAVNHAGIDEDKELASRVSGIDIIVGGHSHTQMEEPEIINETIIVQAGDLFEYLGMLELAYHPATGKIRFRNHESATPYLIALDSSVPLDPDVSAALDRYTRLAGEMLGRLTGGKFNDIFMPVAISNFPLPNKPYNKENQMGNFVTDAMRIVVEQKTGQKVDFASQGSGIIRSTIKPGTMDYSREQILLYDLIEAIALGSGPDGWPGFPLASAYFTGEELYRIMEISALASAFYGDGYFLQASGLRQTYDPDRAVLFMIPGLNFPFPSTRAVLKAERFIGEGRQTINSRDYVPLERRDQELYHVVSDYVLISTAISEVSRQLPQQLAIEPKDAHGNVVENPENLIVRIDGEELKLWQAVLEYLNAQPVGAEGLPVLDDYYKDVQGRIVAVSETTFLTKILLFLNALYIFLPAVYYVSAGIIIFAAAVILLRRRKRGSARTAI
ncbi:MAG: bifunctional metallophosphatase/5'-nucleotidase [Dethiobacteria bacterium]